MYLVKDSLGNILCQYASKARAIKAAKHKSAILGAAVSVQLDDWDTDRETYLCGVEGDCVTHHIRPGLNLSPLWPLA